MNGHIRADRPWKERGTAVMVGLPVDPLPLHVGAAVPDPFSEDEILPFDVNNPNDAHLANQLTIKLFELNMVLALLGGRGAPMTLDIVDRPNPHDPGATFQEVIQVGTLSEGE